MSKDHNWQFDLEEYVRQGEPEQAEKSAAWKTAIGLQDVDGFLQNLQRESDRFIHFVKETPDRLRFLIIFQIGKVQFKVQTILIQSSKIALLRNPHY